MSEPEGAGDERGYEANRHYRANDISHFNSPSWYVITLRTTRKEWYQLLPGEQESCKSDIHVHMQAEAGTKNSK
jgi:hypothetical protein